jgi:hypothetical protein
MGEHPHEHTEAETRMAVHLARMQEHLQMQELTEKILRKALAQVLPATGVTIEVSDLGIANDLGSGDVQEIQVFFDADGDLDIVIVK